MAFQTLSGYCLGRWFHRLRRACGLGRDWRFNPWLVFIHGDGSPWTSLCFRRTYLYPSLETQRLAGDQYLAAFNGGPGNTIPSKFWSLHCYRRAASTQVSLSSAGRHRKCSDAQVYEHARWRRKRSGEKVDYGLGSNSNNETATGIICLRWCQFPVAFTEDSADRELIVSFGVE
jgi:hypothetical protein